MNCKFSILIPVYNRPLSILKALDSVKNQNTNLEFEVLIVDNSGDETTDILKEYCLNNKDMKIVYIRTKCKIGVGNARNIGIRKANGEIVILLDSDDILLEGALNQIGNAFNKYKNLSLYFGSCTYKSGIKINFTEKKFLPYGSFYDYVQSINQPEMLSAFKIKKTNLDFYQFDNRISGFEHLLYLKILRNGGMFFRDSKEIRLYDDVGENRLSITIPKNYINQRNGYFIQLKNYWREFLIYNPRELIFIILKILIYNRLIEKKKFFKINNFLSIIFIPIPKSVLKQLIILFKNNK